MKYLICTLLPVLLAGHTALAQPQQTTVYFEYGRFNLAAEARQALTAALAPLQKGFTADSFSVTAHCDSIGSHVYNDRLARQRLQAIVSWLDSAGLGQAVHSAGFGKRQPLNDNSSVGLRQLNRRAELTIYYRPPAAPAAPVTAKPVIPAAPAAAKPALKQAVEKARVNEGTIVLQNIEFEGGRHVFYPTAWASLYQLFQVMIDIPTLEIEIQGHICCMPGAADGLDFDTNTQDLSVQRAKAVYEYLLRNGIAAKRMRYKGFGRQFPITAERTEEEKTRNRRVEIKILKK